jgi:Mce-associated membrane protein
VEDQSADSSDLTAADAASVPQGKAGRNRHRLPRQKAHQVEQSDDAADEGSEAAVEAADDSTPAETIVEPSPDPAPEVEATEDTAPTKGRRRLPWKRDKTIDDAARQDPADEGEEPEPEVVLVAHRPAGRALKIAAVAAGVLFIGAAAFAGATIQPYLTDRAAVHTKFVIAETAASAITTLWTYTPEDMDKLPERSAKYLGGDFATEYKRYIDAIVAPNKQAQVSNNTQVLGAAVESLTPTEATAIVYTNSVATSPVT